MGLQDRFARLIDLLEMLGLNNRLFNVDEDVSTIVEKMKRPIDWNRIDMILKEKREESIRLLREELS